MKKIVILGSSPAGCAVAEEVRRSDKESEITIISQENCPAYQRHLFGDFLAKDIEEHDVSSRPGEFYQSNNIATVLDKKIAKIDVKRRRITAEDKQQFLYDVLVVAGSPGVRFPEIKGANKTGVFSIKRFGDMKSVLELIPIIDIVSLQADSLAGLKVACGLKKRGKEVIFAAPHDYILSHLLDREPAEILTAHLEKNGIRVITANEIIEILGNGDVKAIKLKNGKVISTQAVLLEESKPDIRLFAGSALDVNSGIVVDDYLRANLEDVFALDAICEIKDQAYTVDDFELSLLELNTQGQTAGLNINGENSQYKKPLRVLDLDFFSLSLVLIGQTTMQAGYSKIVHFDDKAVSYKQMIFKDDIIVGTLLVNAQGEKKELLRCIKEKTGIASAQRQLFGRLVDPEPPESPVDNYAEAIAKPSETSVPHEEADTAGSTEAGGSPDKKDTFIRTVLGRLFARWRKK